MIKYFNTEKFRVLVSSGKKLISLDPGETLEVESPIAALSRYLVDDIPSDSIIEELNQEKKTTQIKKSSRRRSK
jgi:hypothetical protein